jgi:ABC-type multidrug transport system ATPase subunit|uniref:ATP-binding cassette domain-containing protein n=1 Tax=candidate division WOR-3 bacterium TaxID=2052148 RepID=A0A7C3YT70_UNCW3
MSSSAILAQGIVKCFGKIVALNGLDLEVQSGELFGLLGPNGAGKTTTINILSDKAIVGVISDNSLRAEFVITEILRE